MSVRRMTSYRMLLMRSALGRMARAIAYYRVATRAQLRALRSSYQVQMLGYRIRMAASATGLRLRHVPRRMVAALGLVAWFFGQLPAYVGRLVEERREDRAELRAERRLATARIRAERAERRERRRAVIAERRARRRAQQLEIKAAATKRPYALPVPAWISRMERPERPARVRRVPAPRRALVAAAITMAAVVPAYSVVTGAVSSGDNIGAVPDAVAAPAAARATAAVPGAAAGPAAPTPLPSGDTGEFVRTLSVLPTAAPTIPAPRLVGSSAPADSAGAPEAPVVGSLTNPLTAEQQREARQQAKWQAKWEAKMARAQRPPVGQGK